MDLLPNGKGEWGDWLVDLKRTSGFEPKQFPKIISAFHYLDQAFFYRWLWEREGGNERKHWGWLLSDSSFPYQCGVVTVPEERVARAGEVFMAKLDKHIEAIHRGNDFRSPYSDNVVELSVY